MNHFTFIQRVRNKIRINSSAELEIAKNAKVVGCRISIKGKNNKLIIQEGARVLRATLEIVGDNCTLFIGQRSMIGDNCYLSVKEDGRRLYIGDDCGLSRNIKIMTSDGHPIFQNAERINPAKDIVVGAHVWIADNVTLLKGVTIGDGSVIGINSTVVASVPQNAVAVGNPARVVKSEIRWEDKYE
ncbi:MAG: acyltransferase [Campylobacterales bacterium]|nr:acyltransferase [Campylobacterales bacterium]